MKFQEAVRKFWQEVEAGEIDQYWADVVYDPIAKEYIIDPMSKIRWRRAGAFRTFPIGVNREHPNGVTGDIAQNPFYASSFERTRKAFGGSHARKPH